MIAFSVTLAAISILLAAWSIQQSNLARRDANKAKLTLRNIEAWRQK